MKMSKTDTNAKPKLSHEVKTSKKNKKFNISTYHNIKINFFGIPKCGNSTIKYSLLKADNPDKDVKAIHDPQNSTYITKEEVLNSSYASFAILRNPYKRALSLYKHFVLNEKSNKGFGNEELAAIMAENPKMPLNDFIALICRYKDEDINVHFRSQHYFLTHDVFSFGPIKIKKTLPQKMFKLENLKDTISIAGKTIDLINKNESKVGQKLTIDDLSDEAKKHLDRRYRKDFTLWGKAA